MSSRWNLQSVVRQLNWPGVLGIGLLMFAATAYFSGLRPAEENLADLQRSLEARQRMLGHSTADARDSQTPAAQLIQFYKVFPDSASQPDWLEKIFSIANSLGIDLDQGDYKLTRNKEGRIVRLQIAFPVKSNYPQIRKFIAQLKQEIPVVALEHIQFERQKVLDQNVEVKLQLVLYMEQSA